MKKFLTTCLLLCLSTFVNANTLDLSTEGMLGNFLGVDLVQFTVNDPLATVTFRTFSYAGGTNAAGKTIASGGFDPIVTLFDNAGKYIAQNDDGVENRKGVTIPIDPVTGFRHDSLLSSLLKKGDYMATITQAPNQALANLTNGLTFIDGFSSNSSTITGFIDVHGNPRTSSWALDISIKSEPPAAVPLPAAVWLMGSGLVGLVGIRKKSSRITPLTA